MRLDAREARPVAAAMLVAGALLPLAPEGTGIPCPLRTLSGVPCPLCGMTTSVEATMRLDVADAIAANPAGIGAVALALLVLARPSLVLRIPTVTACGALAAMWLFELWRFSVL